MLIRKEDQLNEPIQTTHEVMKNVSAIPQVFSYESETRMIKLGSGDDSKKVAGSVIFNKLKPGSFGYAACLPQAEIDGRQTQRLVTNIFSNHKQADSNTFDFFAAPEKLGKNRSGQLIMKVIKNDPRTAGNSEVHKLFPILVGPGSVSVAEDLNQDELALLGYSQDEIDASLSFDWGGLAKGVLNAIPTIAQTGLEIYKEVSKGSSQEEDVPEGWLSTLGSIASTALPLVAALI